MGLPLATTHWPEDLYKTDGMVANNFREYCKKDQQYTVDTRYTTRTRWLLKTVPETLFSGVLP